MITYSINFKNGLAISPYTSWVGEIVSAEREVTIVKHSDEWAAHNYGGEKYEKQNYFPNGPLLTVPSLAQFQQFPWYTDRFHKISPVNLIRHFMFYSAKPGRVGYFTDIELVKSALDSEPVGTYAVEVPDKAAAVGDLQRLIAKEVLRFSGYFDTRDFQMLCDLPVNQLNDLPYVAWMRVHCVLPSGLQGFSVYGYAEPALEPHGQPKELPAKR